jgi:alpha-ribazole phosphatase
LSDISTLDHIVATKAAKDGFVRTRWWWIRHAPVIVDEGRIYGQSDLPCDCSDARVFASLATLLPRKAVWLTSHLARTKQTAQAIFAAGNLKPRRNCSRTGILPNSISAIGRGSIATPS